MRPAIEVAKDKLRLWFFRECNFGTRRHLFALFGLPLDEIRNHGHERKCLNFILSELTRRESAVAEIVAEIRDQDGHGEWQEVADHIEAKFGGPALIKETDNG